MAIRPLGTSHTSRRHLNSGKGMAIRLGVRRPRTQHRLHHTRLTATARITSSISKCIRMLSLRLVGTLHIRPRIIPNMATLLVPAPLPADTTRVSRRRHSNSSTTRNRSIANSQHNTRNTTLRIINPSNHHLRRKITRSNVRDPRS